MLQNKQWLILFLGILLALSLGANFLLFFSLNNCLVSSQKETNRRFSPPPTLPKISPPSAPPPY